MAGKEAQESEIGEEKQNNKGEMLVHNKRKKLIIVIVAASVLFVGGCVALALIVTGFVGRYHHQVNNPYSDYGMNQQVPSSPQQELPQYHHGFGGRTMQSGDFVDGVVVSVSGDTFVVAGNGKQVTVKKTSSTTLSGTSNTTVVVNDSVIVQGTTADNVLTATSIMVRNLQIN